MATKTAGRRRASAAQSAGRASAAAKESEPMLAQVRLRAEETAEMRLAMARLNLTSTSDASREGLRLLSREAVEVAAADEIRALCHGALAPVPEGVVPMDDADLAAADEAERSTGTIGPSPAGRWPLRRPRRAA